MMIFRVLVGAIAVTPLAWSAGCNQGAQDDADPGASDDSGQEFVADAPRDIIADGSLPAQIYQIAASGGVVLLAEHRCSDGCVSVVDVQNRSVPRRVATFRTEFLDENGLSVLLETPTTAYLGTNFRLFRLDLSTLPAIAATATAGTQGEARDLAFYAGNVVVAEGNFGVALYSAAGQLAEIGRYNPGSNPDLRSITVDGDRAFAGGFSSGILHGISLSNPARPGSAGQVATGDRIWKLRSRSGKIYVANGSSGLRVYDRSLSQIGHFVPEGGLGTYGIVGLDFVGQERLVLADAEFGVRLVNIRDPARMIEEASRSVPGGAYTVAADNLNIYVGDNDGDTDLHLFHLE